MAVDPSPESQPSLPQKVRETIAAEVIEIFVRRPQSLGTFGFTKLPELGDRLYLPSRCSRGRNSRYVVTDVVCNADHDDGAARNTASSKPFVYVSFLEE